MLVIKTWSIKAEEIIFVAQTDDKAEAIRMFWKAINHNEKWAKLAYVEDEYEYIGRRLALVGLDWKPGDSIKWAHILQIEPVNELGLTFI